MLIIPFKIKDGVMRLENHKKNNMNIVFDSGGVYPAIISEKIIKSNNLDTKGRPYEFTNAEMPSCDTLKIFLTDNQSLVLKHSLIDSRIPKMLPDGIDLLIGPGLFKYYVTIIDYIKKMLILIPYDKNFDNVVDIYEDFEFKEINEEISKNYQKLENTFNKFNIESSFDLFYSVKVKYLIDDDRFKIKKIDSLLDTGSERFYISSRTINKEIYEKLENFENTFLFKDGNKSINIKKIKSSLFSIHNFKAVIFKEEYNKRIDSITGWGVLKDKIITIDHMRNDVNIFARL